MCNIPKCRCHLAREQGILFKRDSPDTVGFIPHGREGNRDSVGYVTTFHLKAVGGHVTRGMYVVSLAFKCYP
jgi:hypothetical protein